ncbi:hypothetical protein PVAP13_4NG075411 [Panicum virgatum]|uniref:Uncharacterized protein n=1 Tax=Panicum virgatum TaxID=38727 RepID=A0A8T0T7H0_PANVG|nr:hypothetical protein PVAP13_4NG075411 [Panicum virgatum]
MEFDTPSHSKKQLHRLFLRLNDGMRHQSSVASITEKESQSARETCRVSLTCYYSSADLYSELKVLELCTSELGM